METNKHTFPQQGLTLGLFLIISGKEIIQRLVGGCVFVVLEEETHTLRNST